MDSTRKTLSTDSSNKLIVKTPFEDLWNNEKYSDIYFIVGKGNQKQRIPAHKILLSARSTVFDAMFYGSLATNLHEVEVPDVESSSFLAMLKFIYTNEVQLDPEIVTNTLYAANKYILPALEDHCVDFLKSILVSDNAFSVLTQAIIYGKPELKELCLDTIDKNATDVFNSDCFYEIDLDTLKYVLNRDALQIFESKLFKAIVSWSKAECVRKKLPVTVKNQRSVLGGCLKLIRFSCMTLKDFVNGPFKSELLADDEVKKFCLELASKANIFENPRCSFNFEMNGCDVAGQNVTFAGPGFIVGFILKRKGLEVGTETSTKVIKFINITDNVEHSVSRHITKSSILIKFDRPIMTVPNKKYRVEIKIMNYIYSGLSLSHFISEIVYYQLHK